MRLILARHGNTFAPGDKVVWTGSSNDLPLVEAGFAQARAVAAWLADKGIKPDTAYCSHLQRTRDFARTVLDGLASPAQLMVDQRLDEIDYGTWTGKSDDEVVAAFGADGLEGWRTQSRFPAAGEWGETESRVVSRVMDFVEGLKAAHYNEGGVKQTVFIVSSNGILRYFLKAVPGAFEEAVKNRNFNVKTGNLCGLDYDGKRFKLLFWNEKP